MNGRIYDPRSARFLQADAFVPDPTDTQSLNRYSYTRNNPLNATDPSGYFDIISFIVAVVNGIADEYLREFIYFGIASTC